MEILVTILITLNLIFIGCSNFIVSARNVSSIGICEIEVPVASILPPDQRHMASSIRGNGTTPSFSKIKICCSGYRLAPYTPFHCLPDCPNGCGLGNCTAPNICSCYKGAILGPNAKCIEVCPKSCLNGQCYNNFCNCNRGFILEQNGKYCVAGCTRNCGPGGMCVGNNQCKCDIGYQLNGQGICSVFCEKGYQQVNNICEPICYKGCQNGTCTAPNTCSCNPGWTLDPSRTICSPKCAYPCLNGVCSAPNVCTCKRGYIKDPNDTKGNRCIGYCPQGCPNGFCTAPNFCICNHGYVKQARGSNVCVKK